MVRRNNLTARDIMTTLAAVIVALTITVSIETPEQIQNGWDTHGSYPAAVAAWAEWSESCTIHVPPLTRDTLKDWVHEIKHCKSGQWHD